MNCPYLLDLKSLAGTAAGFVWLIFLDLCPALCLPLARHLPCRPPQ